MKLFTTTAAALAMTATGAFANIEMTDDAMYTAEGMAEMRDSLIRTRDITGAAIYTTNEANDEGWNPSYDAVGTNWNEIGEIEDIVLDSEGQMIGVVAEIGGFLDIGDKHVMLPMNDVRLVPVDDRSYSLVTRLSEEQLEGLPSVDEGFWN